MLFILALLFGSLPYHQISHRPVGNERTHMVGVRVHEPIGIPSRIGR